MILKYWQRNQLWESFRVESLSGFLWETIFFFSNMTLFCLHLQSGIFLVTTVYKRKKKREKDKSAAILADVWILLTPGQADGQWRKKVRIVYKAQERVEFLQAPAESFSSDLGRGLSACGGHASRLDLKQLKSSWNMEDSSLGPVPFLFGHSGFPGSLPLTSHLWLPTLFFFFFKSDMSLRRRSAIFIPDIDLNFFFFL